ncbi:rhomboid family intramembrane serine protease [Pseudonocardia spinosispora]|uniref:rhomboid family intramembrane serine protease n=1 Tax=Pseudonocardia spinosispora TaxID=103441 RepID=UPI001FDF66D8|nr:rhomboid family intramembrane serine protease [Pseudonocardia spinosispora]
MRCARCEQPYCPECLREASVGFHCVDCLAGAARQYPAQVGRTVAGAIPVERAIVVPVLIVLNVAVFVWTVVQAGSVAHNSDSAFFESWSLLNEQVFAGEWWRLFTAGFLHFGMIHLAFNMYALWIIGKECELALGRLRFLAVYVVGLLGGSAASLLFGSPYAQVAGASGAVFGLMGGLAVLVYRLRMSPRGVLILIGLNLALSFIVPNISILGHVGGLVTGAALTAALVYAPLRNRNQWQATATIALVALLLLAMAIRATLA